MSSTKSMLIDWLQMTILKVAKQKGTVTANDVRELLFRKFGKEIKTLSDHNFIGTAFASLLRAKEIRRLPGSPKARAKVRHGNEIKIFEAV